MWLTSAKANKERLNARGVGVHFFLHVVAGLGVKFGFMAFGGPFEAFSARCAGEVWAGAEEAAERGRNQGERHAKHSSGAKALADFVAFTARLKSCPDTYCGSG